MSLLLLFGGVEDPGPGRPSDGQFTRLGLTGTAAELYGDLSKAPPGTTYSYSGSGGMVAAGSAGVKWTKAYLATGGMIAGGSATTSTYAVHVYTPSGGMVAGGAATIKTTKAFVASGGMVAAGAATIKAVKAFLASGGMVASGSANTSFVLVGANEYSYAGSGGMQFAGAALALFVSNAPVAESESSGGYGPANAAAIERQRSRWLKRQRELEEEADRLEMALAAEGLVEPAPEVANRHAVTEYRHLAETFSRRTQRAIDYAERARTALAYELAAKAIAQAMEDEEIALLMALALAA